MPAKQFKPWTYPEDAVHIALDLETASLEKSAAIVQLAAAVIPVGAMKGCYPTFDSRISLQSCEHVLLHVSKETMEWWNTQDPELRKKVFSGTTQIGDALLDFYDWTKSLAGTTGQIVLWGNGTEFDNVVLQNAWELFMEWPFHYRNAHHLRTLLTTVPLDVQERAHNRFLADNPGNVQHDALHDARYQAHMIYTGLIYHGLY